jgi:hypothetical protein
LVDISVPFVVGDEPILVPDSFINVPNIRNAITSGMLIVVSRDYLYASSDAQTSTTSMTFIDKVSLQTDVLTGTYWIEYCAEAASSGNDNISARLQSSDGETLAEVLVSMTAIGETGNLNGFAEVSFSGQQKTFSLQYKSGHGRSVEIRRARIRMIRKP